MKMWTSCYWIILAIVAGKFKSCSLKTLPVENNPFVADQDLYNSTQSGPIQFTTPEPIHASTIREPVEHTVTSSPLKTNTSRRRTRDDTTVDPLGYDSTIDPSYFTDYPQELNTDDYYIEDGFTEMPYDYTDYPGGYTDYPLDYDEADDENVPLNYSNAQLRYYSHLYEKLVERVPGIEDKGKSPYPTPANRCVRKEYRLLSDDERTRFHNAINALKRDESVDPNKYDSIALLHSGGNLNLAHRGPGFLGWHRIYLMIYETALQEVDPSVCLAYWDTTMEARLHRPAHSTLWSPDLLGTPNGPVVDGPFANWTTPLGGPLLREVGDDGSLFTSKTIANILSRYRQEDITTSEDLQPRFDLESFHESAHAFSGGAMKTFATAAFDPMFYLLHTFIDYVWSLFRENLKRRGVNPEHFPNMTDVNPIHDANATTRFGNLTHADGFKEVLAQAVTYGPSPVCSERRPDCGSRYLTCKVRSEHCLPTKVTRHTTNAATASQTTTAPVTKVTTTAASLPSKTTTESVQGQTTNEETTTH